MTYFSMLNNQASTNVIAFSTCPSSTIKEGDVETDPPSVGDVCRIVYLQNSSQVKYAHKRIALEQLTSMPCIYYAAVFAIRSGNNTLVYGDLRAPNVMVTKDKN